MPSATRSPLLPGRSRPIFALLTLAALLGLSACGKTGAGGPPGGLPPAEVAVVAVAPQALPVSYEYTGQVIGFREVEVRARVTGILIKRNYAEGGPVKAGQSLFTIDPAPFDAALRRGEADLASAEARLSQAQRNVVRLKPLYEAKAVSQKEYDDAVSADQIAAADVKAARARLVEARLNMQYTRVESPIGGVASRALKSEGSLVSGPDVLLTTVTQVDPVYVIFGIPDNERLKLQSEVQAGRLTLPKDGRFDVTLTLADGSKYAKAGKVDFADVRINNTTGTSEARAELPNSGNALRAGQFVRVRLDGGMRPSAMVLPQRAVLEGPQGKFVYVVSKEGKAESRPVEVGDWSGESWIINKGIATGDSVIVDGVMKIGPGAPVKVGEAKPAGGQPQAPAAQTTAQK